MKLEFVIFLTYHQSFSGLTRRPFIRNVRLFYADVVYKFLGDRASTRFGKPVEFPIVQSLLYAIKHSEPMRYAGRSIGIFFLASQPSELNHLSALHSPLLHASMQPALLFLQAGTDSYDLPYYILHVHLPPNVHQASKPPMPKIKIDS